MFKTLQYLRWVVAGLIVIVLFLVTIENSAAEEWEIISQLPTKRWAFSTVVVDGKIYLIGGTPFKNENGGPLGLSTVEVYDTKNNRWQRLTDMPTPRLSSEAAVVDGKIYVVGGFSWIGIPGVDMKMLNVVEVYDPQTDTWSRTQDMSTPRRYLGTGVVDDKIYAIGGENLFEEPQRLDLVEVYDPVNDIWAKRADMPTIRDDVKAAVVRDTIYVIGGAGWPRVGWGPVLATLEAYHPKTNRWQKKSDMPNLIAGFSTVVVDDKIYLIGGHGGVAFEEYLKTVEVYDPETERWDTGPPMPTGNSPFGAEAVNGKIYILGSQRGNREFSLDVEVFDTGFRAVTATGKLPVRWAELKAPPPPLRN